jgi:hypothetical protein
MSRVYVWKAPEGTEAKYVVVDEQGKLIFAVKKLEEVRRHYKDRGAMDKLEIVRELEKTYTRKK